MADSKSTSSAGIEISHDDAEHLAGEAGLALGYSHAGAQLAVGIGQIAVRPRYGRQAGAAAANEPRALRRGDATLEAGSWRLVPAGCQRIGEDRVDNPAGKDQRQGEFASVERIAAVGERPLEDGPQLRVAHELELPGPGRPAR